MVHSLCELKLMSVVPKPEKTDGRHYCYRDGKSSALYLGFKQGCPGR
jgi:hypothetical protein